MAKRNPLKTGWVKSALDFIEDVREAFRGEESSDEPMSLGELGINIIEARARKTDKDRGATWYETLRDNVIIDEMMRRGLTEIRVNSRTFCQLVPNLAMGKGDAGQTKYENLSMHHSKKWVRDHVSTTTTKFWTAKTTTRVRDPRFAGGKVITGRNIIAPHTEVIYTFVGDGTPNEELLWTIELGNRPTLEIGEPPTRAKQGKPRNAHAKKA